MDPEHLQTDRAHVVLRLPRGGAPGSRGGVKQGAGVDNLRSPAHGCAVDAQKLERITPDTKLIVGGNRLISVPPDIAEQFCPGDALAYVEEASELLLIPAEQCRLAGEAVDAAAEAFGQMRSVSSAQVDDFYRGFARRLRDDEIWGRIRGVNERDVQEAKRRGRSTTRLVASEKLRQGMIEGLLGWLEAAPGRGRVVETVRHEGWRVELLTAELGIVAFVFEGRPNVISDATGVLKGGNTVVFRIGRDALRTAESILEFALAPALEEAGLPRGAVSLVRSREHASGWALFRDRRISLAVARGSGRAVSTLGSLARQSGVPVSVHGTGGAWLVASESAGEAELEEVVYQSLDRKVCNTLNVCCLPRSRAQSLVPAFVRGLQRAAQGRGAEYKLHVAREDRAAVGAEAFEREVEVVRAGGPRRERQAESIERERLGTEWEWEESPEVSLVLIEDLQEGVALFNRHSPQFVACLLSSRPSEHDWFYEHVNAPFVGDGFTRWVDGQYALRRPELGLSNWQAGRLLARAGVLSGDGIHTLRTRVRGGGHQSR